MVGDEPSTIKDSSTRFVAEKVCVDVGDTEGAGALDDEMFANLLFAEGEVRGGGVKDEVDAIDCERASGAIGDPSVFTDFKGDADAIDIKDQITDEDVLSIKVFGSDDALGPRVEPAWFVVETVSGKVLLRDKTCDFSVD